MILIDVIAVGGSVDHPTIGRQTCVFDVPPQVQSALIEAGYPPERLASEGLEPSVWGHRRALDFLLEAGDRVELTRALRIDPKLARAHKVSAKPRRGWIARKANVTVNR